MVIPPTRFRCNVCGFSSADSSRFFGHMDKHKLESPPTEPHVSTAVVEGARRPTEPTPGGLAPSRPVGGDSSAQNMEATDASA